MKQPKHIGGRGGFEGALSIDAKNGSVSRKIVNKKHGIPRNFTEADVLECEAYCRVYFDWFYGRLQRIERGKKKAAKRAQAQLQSLLLNSISELLRIALDETDSAAKQLVRIDPEAIFEVRNLEDDRFLV